MSEIKPQAREWKFRVIVNQNEPHTIWDGESLEDLNMKPGSYHVIEKSAYEDLVSEIERTNAELAELKQSPAGEQLLKLQRELVAAQEELAAERALADKLAAALENHQEAPGHSAALAAWREARGKGI